MLEWITARLLAFFEHASSVAQDRRETYDRALKSVSYALHETYLYYRDIDHHPRDPERERHLCHLWAAAAVPVRHLDIDLAAICEYKAEYWVNPDNWSMDDIRTHLIQLAEIRDRYRSLLSSSLTKIRISSDVVQSVPFPSA
jgi:hypothetical protein